MSSILSQILIVLIGAVILLSGCATRKFVFNGMKRDYTLYKPKKKHLPVNGPGFPLVLVLHGNPSNGWQLKMYSGMNKVARKSHFAVAYPTAAGNKWPINDLDEVTAELAYLKEVISEVGQRVRVDSSRIYVSGISGGGIFSIHAACNQPSLFAGTAVIAGNLPRSIDTPLTSIPVPALVIHGTADYLYRGTDELMSVEQTIEALADQHGCSPEVSTVKFESRKNSQTGLAKQLDYECLREPLRFILIEGGGHHWPGANFNANTFYKGDLGPYNRDFRASEAIWQFFDEAFVSDSTVRN